MVDSYFPSADKDVATKDYVSLFALPIGTIAPYGGTSAPTGWLICNGQAVSRTTYTSLFALIGTVFGAGDGSTTFNVPDLRGRAAVALDNLGGSSADRITGTWADSLGGAGGTEVHSLSIAEMPPHTHELEVTINAAAGAAIWTPDPVGALRQDTLSTGGGGAHNNVQPSLALGYIIKT